MMTQGAQTTARIDQLPVELGSAQSKLVYLTLEATGGATVADLSDLLHMRKLSILSVLSSLEDEALIERADAEYVVVD